MGLDMMLVRRTDDETYEEVGYWRKANAIHGWFVRNVQNNVDDCGDYTVTKDQLRNLLMACELVLHDPVMSSTYLPTTSGFFFGNVEYDQWYLNSLESTIEIIKPLIDDQDEYYYSSSW